MAWSPDNAYWKVTCFGPNKKRTSYEVYTRTQAQAEGLAERYAAQDHGGKWIAGLVKGPQASPFRG